MTENLNLALDFREASKSEVSGKARPAVARVFIDVVCSYLKESGAPTITADCASFPEFEAEIERLKGECDALLKEAKQPFDRAAGATKKRPPAVEAGPEATRPREGDIPAKSGPALLIGERLLVSDVMTRDVKTMGRNQKLSIADELMKVGKFRHVIVTDEDGGEIAGIISHRDIFYGALAWSIGQGKDAHQRVLDTMLAKEVMHSEVVTVAPSTPLADAAGIMLERKIGCLPVVDANGVIGILTEGDFLALLTHAETRDAG